MQFWLCNIKFALLKRYILFKLLPRMLKFDFLLDVLELLSLDTNVIALFMDWVSFTILIWLIW